LWWISDDPRLPDTARAIIGNAENELFLSAASGLEMAIKAGLGKLKFPADISSFICEQLAVNDISPLPVQMNHALHVYSLPPLHRDPFDRVIVAQALLDDLPVLTADPQISQYPVKVLW